MEFIRGLFKDKEDRRDEATRLALLTEELNKYFHWDQIRVIIYKDGCKILYDSQTLQERNTMPPQRKPMASKRDEMFGDAMLGAVPLALDGITTKVHHFAESSQILISKLFCIVQKKKVSNYDEEDDMNEERKSSSQGRIRGAENGTPSKRASVSASAYSVKPQRTTYAIGVIFTYSSPVQFSIIHTHFPFIDMRIRKMVRILKHSLELRSTSGYYSQGTHSRAHGSPFGNTQFPNPNELQTSITAFRQAIHALFGAPRIESPLWSAVSTTNKGRAGAYTQFLNALKILDSYDDTKQNNFLSTLITGILTHNLSWLRSLDLSSTYLSDEAKDHLDLARRRTGTSVQNPLMWQLEDLFGYFSTTRESTRTIIISHDSRKSHVDELLLVCSYFIRCTQVSYVPTPDHPEKLYPPSPLPSYTPPPPLPPYAHAPSPPPPPDATLSPQANGHTTHTAPSSSSLPPSSSLLTPSPSSSSSSLVHTDGSASWSRNFVGTTGQTGISQNFSYSMYGAPYAGYVGDMALSATSLSRDSIVPKVLEDLNMWLEHPPFQTRLNSSSCILANLSSRKCEVLTYTPTVVVNQQDELVQTLDSAWFSTVPATVNRECTFAPIERAEYIATTLASVRELWLLGIPPESCIMFLEDRLRNVYIRSLTLVKNFKLLSPPARITFEEAADLVGCGTSASDMPLLVSIAQGILLPTDVSISVSKEQGLWYIMVEPVKKPIPPTSNLTTLFEQNAGNTSSEK